MPVAKATIFSPCFFRWTEVQLPLLKQEAPTRHPKQRFDELLTVLRLRIEAQAGLAPQPEPGTRGIEGASRSLRP
jgi:hypothetical protein